MTANLAVAGFDWDAIPNELWERRQWVGWRLSRRPGSDKPTKQPLRPFDGALASTTDSTTWGTADQALQCPGASGIGFVFTNDDPFVGIDLDRCRDADSGAVEEWARDIVAQLDSYTEVSPSGTGLHVIIKGVIPGDRRRRERFEVYSDGRYFTMTGHRLEGTRLSVEERTDQLSVVYRQVFGETTAPSPAVRPLHLSFTDDEIVSRAGSAANGPKFNALWSGDLAAYPSASEADLALCGLLAFWTGPDAERIDRLFRASALMRPKWDERHGGATYGQNTVRKALSEPREYYDQRTPTVSTAKPADARLNDFPLTQAGSAEAFAYSYRGQALYDHRRGRWLLRGPHHWHPDEMDEVIQLAKAAARERHAAALTISDDDRRRAAVKFAMASESRQHLDATLSLAQSEAGIADRGDTWDDQPMLLGVLNGVVDLATGALRPGRPDDRISLSVPLPYRPDAECPRWSQFLEEIFLGRRDQIAFVQRAVGYSLTGDVTEHALFLLYGVGRNGKSVFLNIMRAVAGQYGINLPFSAFELMGRSQLTPELALLPGKRVATSSETNDGVRLNEARIKAMTGGDSVTANPKYVAPFEFTPTSKYWLAVNHLPVVRDDSEGFWQRVRLINFERTFTEEERDKHLEERLRSELPGILAWAVRGAAEWSRLGLQAPASVRLATEEYRLDSDPLNDFLQQRCVTGEGLLVSGGDLFKAYVEFAEAAGIPPKERFNTTMFGRRIGQRFSGKTTNRGKVYSGLGLVDRTWSDGFGESGGFEARSQETPDLTLSREEFWENPSQPITFAEPVTSPTCDDGCGAPVECQGELCDDCATAARGGGQP